MVPSAGILNDKFHFEKPLVVANILAPVIIRLFELQSR